MFRIIASENNLKSTSKKSEQRDIVGEFKSHHFNLPVENTPDAWSQLADEYRSYAATMIERNNYPDAIWAYEHAIGCRVAAEEYFLAQHSAISLSTYFEQLTTYKFQTSQARFDLANTFFVHGSSLANLDN